MCSAIKIVLYLSWWTILSYVCLPIECFLCLNPFHLLSQQTPPTPQISTQPIQIRVPKNKVNEIRERLQNDPNYMKDLINRNPGSNVPITIGSNGRILQPGSPNAASLPREIMIGNKKYVRTTRLNILLNRLGSLRNTIQSVIPAGMIGNNNLTPDKRPKRDEGGKEDEEDNDEDEDEEESDEDNDDDEKPNRRGRNRDDDAEKPKRRGRDEDDDAEKPKRRGRDENDDDENPKRRGRDKDNDDQKPQKRGRDEDDEEEDDEDDEEDEGN